jgi:hypothetical protein
MNTAIEVMLAFPQLATIWRQVDTPSPIWGGPGVALLQTLGGVAFALALSCMVLGGIAAGLMVGVGHFSRNSDLHKKGLIGLGGVVGASAALGSIGGLITWGLAQHVIGS